MVGTFRPDPVAARASDSARDAARSRVYWTVDQSDDRQLAGQAQAGDLAAFDELVRRYHGMIYCYLYRTCRNSADAEEMTQESFVKAWEGLKGFRGAASFKTWLYRIATNLCINRLSRRKPHDPLSEDLPAARRDEPEESLRQRVRSECIGRALAGLPADQRSALVLSIYEELSHEEIGRILDIPPAEVNRTYAEAGLHLRALLAEAA